jgi:hypothetical protein
MLTGTMVASHTGQKLQATGSDKSPLMTLLRYMGHIPGDYLRTFFYLNFIYGPRRSLRRATAAFYRMDHVYEILKEARGNYKGPFSILEFGVADGYAFTKKLYATRYLGMADQVIVHGFDTFEGMPETSDQRDRGGVIGGDWQAGQFHGSYEALDAYCRDKYLNYDLHKGLFEHTITPQFLDGLGEHRPILVWIDCDYYSSARAVMERIWRHLPTGCVIYFDEYEFNFGSRLTGEARLVHEINQGLLGDDVELVLDGELSWDLHRCYRFINLATENPLELRHPPVPASYVRRRTNDSPLP